MFNTQNECGIGAVVDWAGNLWAITYAPHKPNGSDDRLYRVSKDLEITAFDGSIGGTPANRLIHTETDQLVIGPYVIDAKGQVRVLPRAMVGRFTGTARHLTEPDRKVYVATMEEGIYEVDLDTLDFTTLFADEQGQTGWNRSGAKASDAPLMSMPGYHGKGLYSGQGRLIYANNGEAGRAALERPDVPSGVLAEWTGGDAPWRVVRRAQFTDVRGPGGLHGNSAPATDPVWAIGWDHRSLLLMLLEDGRWSSYRLPKGSHTYDGAHGWNTEWPRFRDLGDPERIAMNMHGTFWSFPRGFRRSSSSGIAPRSTYLKVIGDYTRWGPHLVFGCDDTAKSEFLNKRRAKASLSAPGQSHSNLWFASPTVLDKLGPPLGRGAVWLRDDVAAGACSEPYLLGDPTRPRGFHHRSLWLTHGASEPRTLVVEVDSEGSGAWQRTEQIDVPAGRPRFFPIPHSWNGAWIRLTPADDTPGLSAVFHYRARDPRPPLPSTTPLLALPTPEQAPSSHGRLLVLGDDRRTLGFAAASGGLDGQPSVLYELDADLVLRRSPEQELVDTVLRSTEVADVIEYDAASAIYVDDDGQRWRLPRATRHFPETPGARVDREVVTERDLFQCAGLLYELPARNAGGFAKIRPITTHGRVIRDYCSYRGLMVMSGLAADPPDSAHVVRSEDGQVSLWVGAVDDLWRTGKPVGVGGPWLATDVEAGELSDPYLITGFDRKTLHLAHAGTGTVKLTVEVDISGDGEWVSYATFAVAEEGRTHVFPASFGAYWVRVRSDRRATVTAQLRYE
ncbi:MAG: hypothetical protein AAF682_00035 [Planctomycetota bacterium]